MFEPIAQPLRHSFRDAWRSLRSTPATTAAALACVALGVGSAVFMMTVLHAVLLQSAPFPDADRLVRLWTVTQATGAQNDVSFLDFGDIAERSRSFDRLEMTARTRYAVTTAEGTERFRGESVSPGYFDLIALKPVLGRLFTPEEHRGEGAPPVLLGHEFWQRKFGGDAAVLGQTLRARSTYEPETRIAHYTIVGVLPAGFVGTVDPDVSDFWIPAAHYAPRSIVERRTSRGTWVLGRLAPGATLASAQAEIARIGSELAAEHPSSYEGLTLGVAPFGESWRGTYRSGLLTLFAAALLLLLIACTNVANLLLERLARREHELTLRLALGAPRRRILGQLLGESLLLSLVGGTGGALVAFAGVRLFAAARILVLPPYVEIAPDPRLIAIAAGLVFATGVLFGVLPAWFGSRVDPSQKLRAGGRSLSLGRRQGRQARILAALQVAFTFVLLAGALLLLRSYGNLQRQEVGFRTENLLRMAISLNPSEYPDAAALTQFAAEARERLGSQPGVERMTVMAGVLPPWFDERYDLAVDGAPVPALQGVGWHSVDNEFFPTLGMPIAAGRGLTATDRADSPRVAVISRALAGVLAGDEPLRSVIGRPIQLVTNRETRALSRPIEIVGVVGDIRYHGVRDNRPAAFDFYVPFEQAPDSVLSFAFHTSVEPSTLVPALQRTLGAMAPTSPQHWISTMAEEMALQTRDARFYAWMPGIFATSAALLAALGIYGVFANSVSRRIRELGIRLAVGAEARDIRRLIVRQGLVTVSWGLLMGVTLALVGARFVASLLHGVPAHDPLSLASVAITLLALGVAACLLPARRASRTDPVVALRGG